jgi:hypothetical protein
MGLAVSSPDDTEQLNLIMEELQQIIEILADIQQEVDAINHQLGTLDCYEQQYSLTYETNMIDYLLGQYNEFVTVASYGGLVSNTDLSYWVDQVMALGPLLTTMADQLLLPSSGAITACIQALEVPADNTSDTPYYDQVAQFTNYYYYYQAVGLWLLTEAQHYQAWVAAGSPNSGSLYADSVPQVCKDPSATEYCIAAAAWTNEVYNSLVDQFTAAGAPYTDDWLAMEYDATSPHLWVKSLEDFTAAAGDDCPYPLTSSGDACGVTARLWDDPINVSGINYRGYTDWNHPIAYRMNLLLSGWTDGTPGNYLQNTFGFQNMQNKILLSTSSVADMKLQIPDTKCGNNSKSHSKNIGSVVVFVDTDIDKNDLDQPVQTQDAVDQLYTGEKTKIRKCGPWYSEETQYKQMFNRSSMLPSNRKNFYELSARRRYTQCNSSGGGCKRDFEWYTKPGWLADVTAYTQYISTHYGLVVLRERALFTDHCTEGRSTKNIGGVWSKCGDDFTQWLNTTVPRPPSCTEDPTLSPACYTPQYPLLDYTANSDYDGNLYWENQTYITGYNWVLYSPTKPKRVTGVSALPGISAAYEFKAGWAGVLEGVLQDLPGDPTDNSVSFEVWFKPSDLSGDEIIFEVGGDTHGISLALSGSNLLATWGSNGVNLQIKPQLSSTEEFIQAIVVIEWGPEEHYAKKLRLYINGSGGGSYKGGWGMLAWSGPNPAGLGGISSGINGDIGGNNTGLLNGFGDFVGQIAIVRIYDHALSAHEVAQLYTRIAE